MARGLWVSPSEFVKFAEPNKTLTEQIASRSRSIDFFGLGMYLPNPDPILKSQGRDIRIYRELRTDPLVGGCIRRRKAAVKSLERGLERGHAPARVSKRRQRSLLKPTRNVWRCIRKRWNCRKKKASATTLLSPAACN